MEAGTGMKRDLPLMARAPWEDDPWLRHTRGSRVRLVAAYLIAFLVLIGFLLLGSLAGF